MLKIFTSLEVRWEKQQEHIDGNIADAYYTSQDRSIFCAENESNAVSNYYKEQEAIKEGYTNKTWCTVTHLCIEFRLPNNIEQISVFEGVA